MNRLKTPLVDKVLSGKVVHLLVVLELASTDFKTSFREVDKEARVASPSVIYSMSSKRCLEEAVASKEGPANSR
jgi:hypothetical protein